MTAYSTDQLAVLAGGTLHQGSQAISTIRYLLYDSRKLAHPSETLFVAIRTSRNDGHFFIPALYANGVRNFLVEVIPTSNHLPEANFIVVENAMDGLKQIAANHRNQFDFPIVGITGSNGKTIVKEWLFSLLKDDFNIARSPKSFNSQLGVALSLWNLGVENNLAIIEAGISQMGEMIHLSKMIRPTSGIFTNIGSAHAENFEGLEEKVKEKLQLFYDSKLLIYCADHLIIEKEIQQSFQNKTVSWGFTNLADVQISPTENPETFTLTFSGQKANIHLPFSDHASVENTMHCITWMLANEYDLNEIQNRLQRLDAPEMRLQILQGRNNCMLINDAWIADIDSLQIALQTLSQQPSGLSKTVILSDILESGLDANNLYHQVGDLLNAQQITKLIGVGENIAAKMQSFNGEKHFFQSTEALLFSLPLLKFQNEAILLKGARMFEFEKVAAALQLKTHETVLEINLSNLVHNLNYYKSKLPPKIKMMAMVKAFSYGSGSIEVATALQFSGVDYLAVAYADEGMELRRAGVNLPIMVMNPDAESIIPMIENRLEPEIYSFRILHQFIEALQKRSGFDTEQLNIHIKLDTGMHRLGFEEQDLLELTRELNLHPQIGIASVFSHLAASSDPEHDEFTQNQIAKFKLFSEVIETETGKEFLRHILNSGGISRHPNACFDMVRLGIGMYGIGELEDQTQLLPVGKLSTTISQIRTVKSGETIGYSRRAQIIKDTRVATIPIGYADGFSRKLGHGKFTVMTQGKMAPTIGSICMDMCMIDITDIPQAQEGDQVLIFQTDSEIRKMAEVAETIPYEVLTSISPRVKRVYFQE
jgi:alanine racemase